MNLDINSLNLLAKIIFWWHSYDRTAFTDMAGLRWSDLLWCMFCLFPAEFPVSPSNLSNKVSKVVSVSHALSPCAVCGDQVGCYEL